MLFEQSSLHLFYDIKLNNSRVNLIFVDYETGSFLKVRLLKVTDDNTL